MATPATTRWLAAPTTTSTWSTTPATRAAAGAESTVDLHQLHPGCQRREPQPHRGGAVNGTGNALANIINGNGAANQLFGGAGLDTLNGGAGNDVINGGSGNDTIQWRRRQRYDYRR